MSVDREDARGGVGGEEHVEEDALLLLEGTGEGDAWAEALDQGLDELLGGSSSDRAARAATSSWEVVVIAWRIVPVFRPRL